MIGRFWVRIDDTYYHVSRILCMQRQLKLSLMENDNMHYLRFGKPHYSFILDDYLVTNVSFSPAMKSVLIQACQQWYFESQISEKENHAN